MLLKSNYNGDRAARHSKLSKVGPYSVRLSELTCSGKADHLLSPISGPDSVGQRQQLLCSSPCVTTEEKQTACGSGLPHRWRHEELLCQFNEFLSFGGNLGPVLL